MCARISQSRWIPAKRPMGRLDIIPLLTSKELSSREGLLDFKNEKYVVSYLLSGQGPASSLNRPAVDILEFLFTGNELQLLTLGGPIYLLPQYDSI